MHAPGSIRTHNPSKLAAVHPRLRPRAPGICTRWNMLFKCLFLYSVKFRQSRSVACKIRHTAAIATFKVDGAHTHIGPCDHVMLHEWQWQCWHLPKSAAHYARNDSASMEGTVSGISHCLVLVFQQRRKVRFVLLSALTVCWCNCALRLWRTKHDTAFWKHVTFVR